MLPDELSHHHYKKQSAKLLFSVTLSDINCISINDHVIYIFDVITSIIRNWWEDQTNNYHTEN